MPHALGSMCSAASDDTESGPRLAPRKTRPAIAQTQRSCNCIMELAIFFQSPEPLRWAIVGPSDRRCAQDALATLPPGISGCRMQSAANCVIPPSGISVAIVLIHDSTKSLGFAQAVALRGFSGLLCLPRCQQLLRLQLPLPSPLLGLHPATALREAIEQKLYTRLLRSYAPQPSGIANS